MFCVVMVLIPIGFPGSEELLERLFVAGVYSLAEGSRFGWVTECPNGQFTDEGFDGTHSEDCLVGPFRKVTNVPLKLGNAPNGGSRTVWVLGFVRVHMIEC